MATGGIVDHDELINSPESLLAVLSLPRLAKLASRLPANGPVGLD
jgi:hypothetical protein